MDSNLPVAAAMAQGIPGVVAADSKVELVQEAFVFTEWPVGTADGGSYFSDVRGGDPPAERQGSGHKGVSPFAVLSYLLRGENSYPCPQLGNPHYRYRVKPFYCLSKT